MRGCEFKPWAWPSRWYGHYTKVVCCLGLSVAMASERPLGIIQKEYLSLGFLSGFNIDTNVCERAVKPHSMNQFFYLY